MAVCTDPELVAPESPIHCPRCGWKGTAADGKVIPYAIVQCPKCQGPCCDGHPPEKKKKTP